MTFLQHPPTGAAAACPIGLAGAVEARPALALIGPGPHACGTVAA